MESVLGRLQEILAPFKTSEQPHGVSVFQDDEAAKRILAAWPELPLTLHEPLAFGTLPQHKANQWKFAWKFRKIDFHDLEKATGITDRNLLYAKVSLLIAHQMIYPDGSVSKVGQTLASR
jgi:hypothetical protein